MRACRSSSSWLAGCARTATTSCCATRCAAARFPVVATRRARVRPLTCGRFAWLCQAVAELDLGHEKAALELFEQADTIARGRDVRLTQMLARCRRGALEASAKARAEAAEAAEVEAAEETAEETARRAAEEAAAEKAAAEKAAAKAAAEKAAAEKVAAEKAAAERAAAAEAAAEK
eukprot:2339188-Prymnesium_polylepis.1